MMIQGSQWMAPQGKGWHRWEALSEWALLCWSRQLLVSVMAKLVVSLRLVRMRPRLSVWAGYRL